MITKILFLSLPFALAAEPAHALTCNDLKTCAKVMHELKGQTYIWEADTQKKIVTSPDLDLDQQNAEIVFTAMLDQAGLARLPVGDGKTFRVLPGAHLKEIGQPIVEATAEKRPDFGNTWDWVTMRYRPKTRELTTSLESAYRLHVPREARLQADYNAGFVIVTASIPVVRQMYEVMRAADVPQTPEVKKYLQEQEAKLKAVREKANKN